VSASTSTSCPKGIENEPDVKFRERCLDSLIDDFEGCYKRQEILQRAEKEAWQNCEDDTESLKRKVDQLDKTLQEEIKRRNTLLMEALLAMQENATARTKQIQYERRAIIAQADLDIAKTRMDLPGRQWSEELMAARYYALRGDAMKDAQSRYLDAYEEAIREHEASLMAEDMELVALHLSWSTKRVIPTRSCRWDLDEKWTQSISLCRLRAAPVRSPYETSKASCRDDLQTRYATAASELASRREGRFKKGAELDTKVQKLVDAITHQRDKELAKLQAKITEIEEEHRRQAEKLRGDYKPSSSFSKVLCNRWFNHYCPLSRSAQQVFDRERDIISKDLRAVQATLTLMISAVQTLGQDPNSLPGTHRPRPPSNQDGSGVCPCGCGRWRPNRFTRKPSRLFFNIFNLDPRQHIYEKFEKQQRADESRRQREVDEDKLRRKEERLKEKRRRREEAEARAEREAREYLREQAKRREEEETRRRDEETRRKREDEERRRAEADCRAREERERKKGEEETTRKRAEEERGAEKKKKQEES
jgi:hypothetical protein